MPDCDDPVTDQGLKNAVPWSDPAEACPVGVPDNTAIVSWVDGRPVFGLAPGVGSAEGGGDNCPPVPPPAVAFVTTAENIGIGEGLFSQLVGGVLQFFSLQFGSGFTVSNDGSSLLIDLVDSGVVSWNDILSKPSEFPPSAHTHTLSEITDAGSAAGADSTDFEAAMTAASQAEMEAGTEAAIRKMSPLRVAQAIAALAASGGHVIEDEGTPVTQRANMNFTGAGVSVADSGGKTVVTIAGAAGLFDERDAWLLG